MQFSRHSTAKKAGLKAPLFFISLLSWLFKDIKKPPCGGYIIWSGRRESNPRLNLGKVTFYH